MNERREPTISPLGNDAQDEPRVTRSKEGERARPKAPPPVSSRPVVVRSPMGPLALLVALLACGGAGYLYWLHQQMQQTLTRANTEIETSQTRIAELERRLTLTGDEASQSLTTVSVQVKENTAEIRKLWGVAHDTNRKAIAELNTQYVSLNKTLQAQQSATQQALADVSSELKVLADLTEAQQSVVARADQWQTQQKQALEALAQKVQQLDALSRRIADNEEAIQAIDAFRLQVNRELLKLRGGQ